MNKVATEDQSQWQPKKTPQLPIDYNPTPNEVDLSLAEDVARQQAVNATGLEAAYWLLAAMCIKFERDASRKNEEQQDERH